MLNQSRNEHGPSTIQPDLNTTVCNRRVENQAPPESSQSKGNCHQLQR